MLFNELFKVFRDFYNDFLIYSRTISLTILSILSGNSLIKNSEKMPENRGRNRFKRLESPEEETMDFGVLSEGFDDFHPMTPLEMMLVWTRCDCNSYIGNGKFKSSQKVSNEISSEILQKKKEEPPVPPPKRREPLVPPPIAVKVKIEDNYEIVSADLGQKIVQEEGIKDENYSPSKLESPQPPRSQDYDEMPMLIPELSNSSSTSSPSPEDCKPVLMVCDHLDDFEKGNSQEFDEQNSISQMPALTPENVTAAVTNQSSTAPPDNRNKQSRDDESTKSEEMSFEPLLNSAPEISEDIGILTPFEKMLLFTRCDYRGKYPIPEDNQGKVDGDDCSFVVAKQKRPVGRPRKNNKAPPRNLKAPSNAKATTKVSSNPSSKKKDRRVPPNTQLSSRRGIRKQKKPQMNLVPNCSLLKKFLSSKNYSSVTSVADQFNFLQTHTKNSV